MLFSELFEKKIAILGMGREGMSTYRFLQKNKVKNIGLFDEREFSSYLLDDQKIFQKHWQNYGENSIILGKNYFARLGEYDVIIKSPGISPYQDELIPYLEKITSQTEIFFKNYTGKVIGITGTKGKSTISTLTYGILKKAGYNAVLVGNVGNPVCDEIDFSQVYDYVVYELSSYQLEGIELNPCIAFVNNIFPDHLDHHLSFQNYREAKENIVGPDSIFITHFAYRPFFRDFENKTILFSSSDQMSVLFKIQNNIFYKGEEVLYSADNIKLPGKHNLENITGVNAICDVIGIGWDVVENTVKSFRGLPHRLEYVKEKNGITFYDDAISTTPESTIAALETFGSQIGSLFLGGTNRKYSFSHLARVIQKYEIRVLVLFPESGMQIKKALQEQVFLDSCTFLETTEMSEAVSFAFKNTPKGKICLLSTASPSYSCWSGFHEKGSLFQKAIQAYQE